MFCKHCGKQIEDNTRFCPFCGGKAADNTNTGKETISADNKITDGGNMKSNSANQLSIADNEMTNKYVWALATVPILASWIVIWLFGISGYQLATLTTFGLNIVFLSMDVKMLKRCGKDAGKWLWLGIILVPVYLFMRASKTDKKYSYGIAWCVMLLLDIIV